MNFKMDLNQIRKKEEFEETVMRRLMNLEDHIINLITPIQYLSQIMGDRDKLSDLKYVLSTPVKIDDRAFSGLLLEFRNEMSQFRKDVNEFDLSQTMAEIKYIGNRLKEISLALEEVKTKGLKQNTQIEISLDGKKMVFEETPDKKSFGISDDEAVYALLSKLSDKQSKIICHRLGLLGENKKTLVEISKIFKVSSEKCRQIYLIGLRKLRHPCRKELLSKVKNKILRKEILGEDENV